MAVSPLLAQMQEATLAARGQGSATGIGAVTMSENNTIKEYQLRYFADSAELAEFMAIHRDSFALVYAITAAAATEMAVNYRPNYTTQAF